MTTDSELLDYEREDSIEGRAPSRTRCLCGHLRRDHCVGDPRQHWPDEAGPYGHYFCLTTHCECRVMKDGISIPCTCTYFQTSADAPVKLKRPSPNDFTPCANCGHERGLHCSGSPRRKPKPGIYGGFRIHDVPYPCTHTRVRQPYVCDSTHCAEVVRSLGVDGNGNEQGEYCDCPKFVNPLLKKRATKTKATSTNTKARAPRKKKRTPALLGMTAKN